MRRTTASRLRDSLRDIQDLGQHYGAETYRGRRVVSTDEWWSKYRGDKGNLLTYLPDTAVPFVEYHVENCQGWLEWLLDYRDLMREKEDQEFEDWSSRGLGALVWTDIQLRLEYKGDMRKVHAEMIARGDRRECLVCQFPDIVDIHATEFGENRGLLCFCKDHTVLSENEWDLGGRKFKEREYRSRNRLCKHCGSPDIVVMETCLNDGFLEFLCAETIIGKYVVTNPAYGERIRRGQDSFLALPREAFQ